MKTDFRISEYDYLQALKLYAKFTPKIISIFSVVVIILILLAVYGSQSVRGAAIGGLGGSFIAVFIGRFVVSPVLARRHYRKYKAIQEPMAIELVDDGLMFYSPDSEGKLRWDKIYKWRQNSDYILVYIMPRLYHIVPKSLSKKGFDNQKLILMLEKNVGKET